MMARFDKRLSNLETVTKDLSDRIGSSPAPPHIREEPAVRSSNSLTFKKKKKSSKRVPSKSSLSSPSKYVLSNFWINKFTLPLEARFFQMKNLRENCKLNSIKNRRSRLHILLQQHKFCQMKNMHNDYNQRI